MDDYRAVEPPPIFDRYSRSLTVIPAFCLAIPAFYAVIPAFCPVIPALYPRHSRESGNPDDCIQARHLKSSTNSSQRIPSPFMGEG